MFLCAVISSLPMHVFGLLTTAKALKDLDEMVESAAVVFSSPSSGENVEKHFNDLQSKLKKIGDHQGDY